MILHYTPTIGFFNGGLGWMEITVLMVLGVLIFGKRLPEVGKSIGKGIVEFKKGLAGIEDDIETSTKQPPRIEQHKSESVDATTAEKTESNHTA